MLFRSLLPDYPGVNPPETPEHGMKTDTHVSQVAFAGQHAMLPSPPHLSSAFPPRAFHRGGRFLSRSRLCSKRTVALGGGWHICHLKSAQRCPFPRCKGGLMRAGGWQETPPVPQGWQERGDGAEERGKGTGEGTEPGSSEAGGRSTLSAFPPGHTEGREGPGR